MADTICASQGPRNPRLGEVLLRLQDFRPLEQQFGP